MVGRLSGKVALISGGASGIGAAQARLFVAEGSQVAISDILVLEAESLASELGKDALAVPLDVTDEAAWTDAVQAVTSAFGRLDILVNTAGVVAFGPLVATELADYMRVVMVNQVGVFLGMRAVAPLMMEQEGGSIINVSSLDGLRGMPMVCSYVASKFAVTGMTKTAALEWAQTGIRVNSIHPGVIRTPMLDFIPGLDLATLMEPSIPLRRAGDPDAVARLALFLASDDSAYCTGAEFVIDGGLNASALPDLAAVLGS